MQYVMDSNNYSLYEKIQLTEEQNILNGIYYDYLKTCKNQEDIIEKIVENIDYNDYSNTPDIVVYQNLTELKNTPISYEEVGKAIVEGDVIGLRSIIISETDYEAIKELVETNERVKNYMKQKFGIDILTEEELYEKELNNRDDSIKFLKSLN